MNDGRKCVLCGEWMSMENTPAQRTCPHKFCKSCKLNLGKLKWRQTKLRHALVEILSLASQLQSNPAKLIGTVRRCSCCNLWKDSSGFVAQARCYGGMSATWAKTTPEQKEARREYQREYLRKRRITDPKFRINRTISSCIGRSLKRRGGRKGAGWEKLVGFTILELLDHLEKQFKPGMTLDNFGEWHIDHIVPVAAFHYSSPHDLDFQRCWALANLQPLWATDNMHKHCTIPHPHQTAFPLRLPKNK